MSVETARRAGSWADGLATVNQPPAKLRDDRRVPYGWRRRWTLVLQVHLSWPPTEAEAMSIVWDQWRTNVFPPPICWDLETIEEFDSLAEAEATEQKVRDTVLVSADLERHVAWLRELAELGFDEINLHHVGQDLVPFILACGEHVLPALFA